ncbi:SDR family oxidoreductase [Candidatus Curtissbacteria bacterium]|nr:SDR family oxidoreductase [Candidatus Curtissbacteria bacterium]
MSAMTLGSNNRPTILVIGAQSMVGSRFCEQIKNKYDLVQADLKGDIAVDITDPSSVNELFKSHQFEHVLLFSAFTDVDAAEAQRNEKDGICWKINVQGVQNIANASKEHDRNLIYISTDFVFDGENGPYSEEDEPSINPDEVSWYGITKLEGEKIVKSLSKYVILRIAYPYRANFNGKDDLLKRILKSYKDGSLYPMFNDQQLTPTFIDDLAPALDLILQRSQKGIFHLSSPTVTTPYDISKKLIKTFGGDDNEVKAGSLIEFLKSGPKTPRPVKGGLKVDKITQLGFKPMAWDAGIEKIHEQSKGNLI